MRTIIEVWQQQADECAQLAKETDDPKRRETFLKLASDWKQTIERGSHDSRGRLHAETPTAGRRGAALGSCHSAEVVDSFSWMGRYTPTSAHRKAPRS